MVGLTTPQLQIGKPWPMGAHFDGHGVNFAVFSEHAQTIELCLFSPDGSSLTAQLKLPGHTVDVWHGYLPAARAGLVYGFRAHGPWRPDRGHRFDASKLLLDPYAREIVGNFIWSSNHFTPDNPHPGLSDTHDNAPLALKARVVHDTFDWGDDAPPATPMSQSILYECHVKGFSQLNTVVPADLRGKCAGLAHPASIQHLKTLGITAVSLLPVHFAISEERLVKLELTNYWGYNTLGFFCLNPALGCGTDATSHRDEFRHMVKCLHAAGIEVILDVVYNHTAEADQMGPTLSWRGLDNASYYLLQTNDPSRYENYSGCGNTLNIKHPKVLQMVMDSLRYWVTDMHVDGFRFDLASVLGRTERGFESRSAFFIAIAQDPVLSTVKLIAEPWDLGPSGYQLGGFPGSWLEWNDRFRDGMRCFWIQGAACPDTPLAHCNRGDFAMRLCGSSDVYQARQSNATKSVNYVVSHDGFTLADLVSYNQRRNLANGENNRDGTNDNLSFNCGAEGPSTEPAVVALRQRLQRVLIATTVLSQGTPMISAGDEIGHSQGGNNNPYCQDNTTTWINWTTADADLLAFTSRVIALRHQLQPFHNHWYKGVADDDGLYDLSWWNADGSPLQHEGWQRPMERTLACMIGKPGCGSKPLLLLVNAGATDASFVLPRGRWQAVLDTAQRRGTCSSDLVSTITPVAACSLVLMQDLLSIR
jgi:glycogen operon protein